MSTSRTHTDSQRKSASVWLMSTSYRCWGTCLTGQVEFLDLPGWGVGGTCLTGQVEFVDLPGWGGGDTCLTGQVEFVA